MTDTDLKNVKVGDRLTVRRTIGDRTVIVRLDIVKYVGKGMITTVSLSRYLRNGDKWSGVRSNVRVFAAPSQFSDQRDYEKQEGERRREDRQQDAKAARESELQGRLFAAMRAELDPSPLFEAMAHYVRTNNYDYLLLERIEVPDNTNQKLTKKVS